MSSSTETYYPFIRIPFLKIQTGIVNTLIELGSLGGVGGAKVEQRWKTRTSNPSRNAEK